MQVQGSWSPPRQQQLSAFALHCCNAGEAYKLRLVTAREGAARCADMSRTSRRFWLMARLTFLPNAPSSLLRSPSAGIYSTSGSIWRCGSAASPVKHHRREAGRLPIWASALRYAESPAHSTPERPACPTHHSATARHLRSSARLSSKRHGYRWARVAHLAKDRFRALVHQHRGLRIAAQRKLQLGHVKLDQHAVECSSAGSGCQRHCGSVWQCVSHHSHPACKYTYTSRPHT